MRAPRSQCFSPQMNNQHCNLVHLAHILGKVFTLKKFEFNFLFSKMSEIVFIFFACILHDYMADDIKKEFWKKNILKI